MATPDIPKHMTAKALEAFAALPDELPGSGGYNPNPPDLVIKVQNSTS